MDQSRARIAKAWHIGRIPWRNIREIDPKGDEYYRGHTYSASSAHDGMPYEELVARELGDDYDWPLDSGKRLSDLNSAEGRFHYTPPDSRGSARPRRCRGDNA